MALSVEEFQDSAHQQFFDLVEHFTIAFSSDFQLLFANRAALRFCQKSLPEIIKCPLFEVFPDLRGISYFDGKQLEAVSREVLKDGEIRQCRTAGSGVKSNNCQELHCFLPILRRLPQETQSEVVGALLMVTELRTGAQSTGQNRNEKTTGILRGNQITRDLTQNISQFATIAHFAMTTADRINTPLNVILGRTELICNHLRSEDPLIVESFDIINREIKRVADIIEEMNQLAISKADEYGLMNAVESEKAATFEPLKSFPAELPTLVPARSILVVDDEEHMSGLLHDVVATLGYHPIVAHNGAQALDLLSRHAIDLVITDINMPGMSGIELLKHIKRQHPQIPVVLITGYGKERAATAAREHNADGFIGKPFRIEELRRWIEKLLI